jgi:NADPH-dependent 2,4-dienoyl-CoA reductase/sulfur reductase-like enzyme
MLHVVAIHGKINGCNSSGLKGIGEKMSRPKIVIVGAGFGGLAAAEVGCRPRL